MEISGTRIGDFTGYLWKNSNGGGEMAVTYTETRKTFELKQPLVGLSLYIRFGEINIQNLMEDVLQMEIGSDFSWIKINLSKLNIFDTY